MTYTYMRDLQAALQREAARDPDHAGLSHMRDRCDRVVMFGQQLGMPEQTAYSVFLDACHRRQSLEDLEQDMARMAREVNGGAH